MFLEPRARNEGGVCFSAESIETLMAVENHPQYQAWNEALERMVEAERRYYAAVMENLPPDQMYLVARELDEARTMYRIIANEIG